MKEIRASNAIKSFSSAMKKSNSYSAEFLDSLTLRKGVPCEMDSIQRVVSIILFLLHLLYQW